MEEASHYGSAAIADPDLRPIYVQMAVDNNKNPDRPFDMAVSDYYHHGTDLLWKKHMGDREKPATWKWTITPGILLNKTGAGNAERPDPAQN
jgi:hypothetical protein